MTVLVAIGVLVTPYLIDVIAPGFEGDKRDLTIQIVRILFPGAGLLVMSAWFLGVLNSHHKFFVSYTAPVAWNVAMIAALLYYGPRRSQDGLAIAISWGSVVGSAVANRRAGAADARAAAQASRSISRASPLRCESVFNNLTPVVISRGVVNLSTYIDNILASLLPTGAVAALNYGQLLYMMPISLFGYSVAASELPAMSRAAGAMPEQMSAILRARLNRGPAPNRIHGGAVVGGLSDSRRRDRRADLSIRRVHPRRRRLRVGRARGLGRRIARGHDGPALQLRVLRAVRYAHAAAVRADPRRADAGARLPVRDSAAAHARNRAEVGRRGTDGVGGHRGMGRVRAAAMARSISASDGPGSSDRIWRSCGRWRWAPPRSDSS